MAVDSQAMQLCVTPQNIADTEEMLDLLIEEEKEGQLPFGFGIIVDLHEAKIVDMVLAWQHLGEIIGRRISDININAKYLLLVGPSCAKQAEQEKAEDFVRFLKQRGLSMPIRTVVQ